MPFSVYIELKCFSSWSGCHCISHLFDLVNGTCTYAVCPLPHCETKFVICRKLIGMVCRLTLTRQLDQHVCDSQKFKAVIQLSLEGLFTLSFTHISLFILYFTCQSSYFSMVIHCTHYIISNCALS